MYVCVYVLVAFGNIPAREAPIVYGTSFTPKDRARTTKNDVAPASESVSATLSSSVPVMKAKTEVANLAPVLCLSRSEVGFHRRRDGLDPTKGHEVGVLHTGGCHERQKATRPALHAR